MIRHRVHTQSYFCNDISAIQSPFSAVAATSHGADLDRHQHRDSEIGDEPYCCRPYAKPRSWFCFTASW